jgi:hypothetical protein
MCLSLGHNFCAVLAACSSRDLYALRGWYVVSSLSKTKYRVDAAKAQWEKNASPALIEWRDRSMPAN